MRNILIVATLTSCVPPTGNDLLGDSDRIVGDTAMFQVDTADSGDGMNPDTAVDEQPGVELSNIESDPIESNAPDPTVALIANLNGSTLSVSHGLSHHSNDIDFSSTMTVRQEDSFIIVHYGITQDPSQPNTTQYTLTYDVNVSSLVNGTYTLKTQNDVRSDTETITETIDTVDFTINR